MKKFNLRISSLIQAPKTATTSQGSTYTGYAKLIDFVSAHKSLGEDLYEVNVRKTLYEKVKVQKNPVFLGISRTLINIYNGIESPDCFIDKCIGVSLMCDSLNFNLNTYEVILTEDYHGVGNGQQTINISDITNNKYPISDDVYIRVQIMVGKSEKECTSACTALNTSNKLSQKDIISKDWDPIAKQLKKIGYTLLSKTDKSIPKQLPRNVINLMSENFYNFLNAYHCETPWITGDETIKRGLNGGSGFNVGLVSVQSLLEVDNLKNQLDIWFMNNISNYDTTIFDSTRTGYIKNVIVTAYKKYFNKSNMSLSKFIHICFDDIYRNQIVVEYNRTKRQLKSNFFSGNQSNCNSMLNSIEKEIDNQNLIKEIEMLKSKLLVKS
jgi:hypothetical protein